MKNEMYSMMFDMKCWALFRKCAVAVVCMLLPQAIFAQSYNESVGQYCKMIGNHPLRCGKSIETGGSIYAGLLMSCTSGDVSGKHTLGGIDLGGKVENTLDFSCIPVKFMLNAYLDARMATYISYDDGESSDAKSYPTVYSGQLTIAPGLRYNRVSVDCGPYVAYSAYKLLSEEVKDVFKPDVSGVELGLRVGLTLHLNNMQIALRYDKALSDQKKQFQKNDLTLSIGTQF